MSQLQHMPAFDIPGWFTKDECRTLYGLVLASQGGILEVGHFLGRSTACICQALQDHDDEPRPFVSYDLPLESEEDFRSFYQQIGEVVATVPDLCLDLYKRGLTATEAAIANLSKVGLLHRVRLVAGDFVTCDHGRYGLVFCDAAHTPQEIQRNIPAMATRSQPGCVWAIHDMNPARIALVESLSTARLDRTVDGLGIFKV